MKGWAIAPFAGVCSANVQHRWPAGTRVWVLEGGSGWRKYVCAACAPRFGATPTSPDFVPAGPRRLPAFTLRTPAIAAAARRAAALDRKCAAAGEAGAEE